jgi:hypothetical protein
VTDAETWCVFDNTAAFAALGNALSLKGKIAECGPSRAGA